MSLNRPLAIRALIASLIISGVAGISYWVSRAVVEQRVADGAQAIARASEQAVRQQLVILDEIPAGSFAECDALNVALLERLAREHPAVAGVFVQGRDEDNRFCTDDGPVTVSAPMVAAQPDAFGLTVGAWLGYRNWEDVLFFSRRKADGLRAVVIKPIDFLFLASSPCEGCLRGHFELSSSNHPLFRAGNRELADTRAIVRRAPLPGLSLAYVLAEDERAVWIHMRTWAWVGVLIATLLIVLTEVGLRYHALRRRSLASLMADAVRREEFLPHYQAIVDVESGRIAGCEVLIRWRQDDGELIPPSQFIETLESTGHIIGATQSMIESALADLAPIWTRDEHFFASVNLVPEHLETGQLERYLGELQKRTPFPAGWLAFEITERLPIRDLDRAADLIAQLRSVGYRFELDDVGTGYGGFSYLQRLGFDAVKLDKMFVDTIGSDDLKLSLVPAIVGFARDAGLEIIAEGVERPEQVDYLRKLGVRLMQGYFFARPMGAQEFVHHSRSRQPSRQVSGRMAPMGRGERA